MDKLLVTGAAGQLGTELTQKLCEVYGPDAVLATDINPEAAGKFPYCRFAVLDVLNREQVRQFLKKEKTTQVYHLAATLSATAEQKPLFAWKLNMDSLLQLLELGREFKLDKIFWPSSIAVFGPRSPKKNTSQYAVKEPNTVYGISKLAGERWCEYYYKHFGVDVRSLRYPGLIGYKSPPGGGTTDYAVDIFHQALAGKSFCSYLEKDTRLPMMYMPDAIKATMALMQAPKEKLGVRSSYNLAALSFTPEELYQGILQHVPGFSISYAPDYRQEIAAGWPQSINDRQAREDWHWEPDYDLPAMIENMLEELPKLLENK
ncbi:NAD-dependent epimerase/dehydratase family protein [Cyclobacterium plantarum]|uniref:NAD-dependent epimerase/dehydratase family protein n=1 Tax=Cyclobacterium plantarum TaxID=2716263 RepID=A0ABX0H8D6_9BACT|nr:NAD-dependent epimerase/dehydratase family protein [Cyclobacterium plantarum]NHE57640.1 NAD-dependent epimerase/dehydratase family protein [Cyclobacterium plantarum]